MDFFAIFVEYGSLYSVCYPEDKISGRPVDIFQVLFDKWADPQYLLEFFKANAADLANPFWKGITIDQAIKQVLREREWFEDQLYAIETKQPGYEGMSFRDLFKPLHNNIYSLDWSGEQFRKARPEMVDSMLRVYAIELEDGSFVITGGVIKLTRTMSGATFDKEIANLKRVKAFLESEGIFSKEGLEAI
ncbi:MAG TPA: hypothetical protein VHE34_06450 [Puia sp.]|uniref:hypothetical protein n=1 Tax=Puia sp. TaxID=2045100 RepID=UPI002C0FFC02|nr:hypothetical protein [Puia sp.]HVU94845.1 hypothetical protein [Puia sp.]